eukprot:2867045-Rhodomonas_salina.4
MVCEYRTLPSRLVGRYPAGVSTRTEGCRRIGTRVAARPSTIRYVSTAHPIAPYATSVPHTYGTILCVSTGLRVVRA